MVGLRLCSGKNDKANLCSSTLNPFHPFKLFSEFNPSVAILFC